MQKSKVKEKLKKGEVVLCSKSLFLDPSIVELMGYLSFDVIWICNEHIGINPQTLANIIRAGRVSGVDIMVRRVRGDYDDLIQPLEMGAKGLMIPHCITVEQVKEIVRDIKFQPLGMRGLDGVSGDSDYGNVPLNEYAEFSNKETFLMVQIEDEEAISNIEEITEIEGVDIIFIGALDLSQSLGIRGDVKNKKIKQVIKRTIKACKRNGKWCGSPGFDMEYTKILVNLGVKFITMGSDFGMIKKGFVELRNNFNNIKRK